jgi:hypothetical protein
MVVAPPKVRPARACGITFDPAEITDARIDEFRRKVFAACPNASRELAALTENLALPAMTAYHLRFGSMGQAGFVELTPDFRLKLVHPEGSSVQVTYYRIEGEPGSDRVRVQNYQTKVRGFFENTPPDFRYIRILFRTRSAEKQYDSAMVFAKTRQDADRLTAQFQASGRCGEDCAVVPPDWAVNAQMSVVVNGEDAWVGIGGTVREAAGNVDFAALHVTRMYRGRATPVQFHPEATEIQQLVLLPGDVITFPKR